MRNLEIKTYVLNLDLLVTKISELGANSEKPINQIDTYFHASKGRLKLRESEEEVTLIAYDRPNKLGTKLSQFSLVKVEDAQGLKQSLEKTIGIKTIVNKNRQVWRWKNSKIHVDQVDGLGNFFEIEVVDFDEIKSLDELQIECDEILKQVYCALGETCMGSYSDLQIEKTTCFEIDFKKKAHEFLDSTLLECFDRGIDISKFQIDHLCWRTETQLEYEKMKCLLGKISQLLVESMVGGRMICTYRLNIPILHKNKVIRLVELPSPKVGRPYKSGFEHFECVAKDDLHKLELLFPGLRLKLSNERSVKFHANSLDKVIDLELDKKTHPNIGHYTEYVEPDTAHYPNSDELLSIGSPIGRSLGLKKIGIHIESLPPGRRTSWPHAESNEEEFAFVLSGNPDVWIDGEVYPLVKGDFVAFPSGTGIAHTFINNSDQFCLLLVGGESSKQDNKINYPLHPQRNNEMKLESKFWESCPSLPLGKHDGKSEKSEKSYYS